VKLGLYFDVRNPERTRAGASRAYEFALEMCEEADRLGAHSIWLSEHHRFEDDYLPQPLTLAAAVAARTRSIRIGTAVMLAPLRSAALIAEEAAVVDQISHGRLELGLGAGYRASEFELYGVPFKAPIATTLARAAEVRRLWDTGAVGPAPLQERVPIWLGFQGPVGARRAGQAGEGLLSCKPELTEPYRAGLQEGGHPPDAARMAGPIYAFVTDDPERDWPKVAPHLAYQRDTYARHAADDPSLISPVDPEKIRSHGLSPNGFLISVPEDAARQIKGYLAHTPVAEIFIWARIGDMPEALAAQHVQTLCRELAPMLDSA
jgi:alkanesulfonate monooxygenase SsuD/methylene tetrahydromethanopterin reductase-like flavin-dependent oxidoreductase (luciferase family)